MKSFRTALLAAAFTAGIPALAYAQEAPQDQGDHRHEGGDRGDRGARPDGGQRPDRGAPAAPQAAQAAPQPQARPQQQPQGQAIHSQDVQRQPVQQQAAPAGRPYGRYAPGQQPGANADVRGQAYDNRRSNDDRRGPPPGAGNDRANGYAPGWNGRPGDGRPGGDYGRPGYGRPDGGYQRAQGNWRGADWRQDHRYDWRSYRDQNRSLFRGSRYVPPRGWAYGYRRFDIGFRLPPFLFGSQYWIADPWAYRLPPVDGPYRWVRYYNDVLLIDLRSGAVVDEIPDFFW